MHTAVIRVSAVAGALVLAGGGVAAYAARDEDTTARYRFATANRGDVAETLTTTGTVDAAGRADVAVDLDGTVARVRAALGQRVRAGQVLATLDRAGRQADVTRARAALAQARAQLEADETAQDEAVSDGVSDAADTSNTKSATTARKPSSATAPDPADAIDAALAELHDQQDAVTGAQSAVTAALAEAASALEAQTEACADAFQEEPTADPTTDPSATAEPTTESTDAEAADADQACTDALALVQERQQLAADAEDALATALTDLTATLKDAIAAVNAAAQEGPTPSQTPSTPPGADQPAPDQPAPDQPATDQPAASSVTAARLASDQAAIDQAEADLLTARQALAHAVIRAPIPGRIVQVGIAEGDTVGAGDSAFVIRSGRGAVVTALIPETQIREVRIGQQVRVTPTGALSPSTGTVTAIGLTADTSSGTASYQVTVSVPKPQAALLPGGSARLEIVVATATDVVTLPVSAVSGTGDTAIVRRLENGELTPVPVAIGAVGTRTVEVTDGIEAGDQVVLADLDRAITDAGTRSGEGPMFMGPGTFEQIPAERLGGPPVVMSR